MYVYPTPRFSERSERHGLQAEVGQLVQALERAEAMDTVRALFEPFPPYWKRRLGRWRLLAKIVRVGDDQVICLLDIWRRGAANYIRFVRDPRRVGRACLDQLLDQDALQRSLTELKEVEVAQQRQIGALEPLPNAIRPWLDPPGWGMDPEARDLVIYESERWVEGFRRGEISDYWQTYHDIVLNIIDRIANAQDLMDLPGVKLVCKDSHCVLFSEIETTDMPARQLLFLLAPFKHVPSEAEIAEVVEKMRSIYTFHEDSDVVSPRLLTLHEVVPFAGRIIDPKNWTTC